MHHFVCCVKNSVTVVHSSLTLHISILSMEIYLFTCYFVVNFHFYPFKDLFSVFFSSYFRLQFSNILCLSFCLWFFTYAGCPKITAKPTNYFWASCTNTWLKLTVQVSQIINAIVIIIIFLIFFLASLSCQVNFNWPLAYQINLNFIDATSPLMLICLI